MRLTSAMGGVFARHFWVIVANPLTPFSPTAVDVRLLWLGKDWSDSDSLFASVLIPRGTPGTAPGVNSEPVAALFLVGVR
jgi:hypothetical protein